MRVRGNSWSKHPMISRSTCAHPVREFLLKPLGGSAMERKRRFCAGAKWPPSGQSHSPGGKDLGCGGQTPSGRPNGSPFEVCDFGDSFSNPHAWAGGMHQLKWTNDLFLHRTYFKAFLVEVRESLKDTRVPLGLVAGRPRRRASSDTWYGLVGWQAFLPSVLTNRICTWSVTLGKTGSMNGATGPQPLPSPFLLSCAGGGANRAEACSETAKENLGMKEPTEAEPNSPEPKMPGRCHCHSRHPDSFSTYFPTCWSRSTGVWTYSRALQTRLHAWPAPPNAPPSPPERSRPPHACCCLRDQQARPWPASGPPEHCKPKALLEPLTWQEKTCSTQQSDPLYFFDLCHTASHQSVLKRKEMLSNIIYSSGRYVCIPVSSKGNHGFSLTILHFMTSLNSRFSSFSKSDFLEFLKV